MAKSVRVVLLVRPEPEYHNLSPVRQGEMLQLVDRQDPWNDLVSSQPESAIYECHPITNNILCVFAITGCAIYVTCLVYYAQSHAINATIQAYKFWLLYYFIGLVQNRMSDERYAENEYLASIQEFKHNSHRSPYGCHPKQLRCWES